MFKIGFASVLVVVCSVVLLDRVAPASAQFTGNSGKAKNPPDNNPPNGGTQNPFGGLQFPQTQGGMQNQNLTPQQLQMLMQMRALQSRGGRGVRTGYPQFIPLGMPGMMPGMMPYNQGVGQNNQQAGSQQPPAPDAAASPIGQEGDAKKSTKERRAEARKAAEEKKKAAKEARLAKQKERAAKAKEAKGARDEKKQPPADEQ